ncbi:sigma-70 family RNA polymerase sigma factor [Nonomuraea sp. NPDC049028]|uniref:sigma-70 family RNA polymerase sigma factor n=1 Tax=Nonomuraea sp. NPDC049028 TaxID=3364348 RepID=UPI00371AFCF6
MNMGTTSDAEFLAGRFEEHRSHLRAVAYRMLGSLSEAEDAVQEGWIRLSRSDTSEVNNLGGWLTTVVARVCLTMLSSRERRREDSLEERLPDPVVSPAEGVDPEHEAVVADSVGLALLVVLESLEPAERLAFVLHDMFAVPFEEIAPIVGRTPAAARQLASRARRRVRGTAPVPDPDLGRQRQAVDAFLAAARDGDFEALMRVLDPDVVVRSDRGAAGTVLVARGAAVAAKQAITFRPAGSVGHPVLVNGAAGVVATVGDRVVSLVAFTVSGGLIADVVIITDADRLARLDPMSAAG